MKRVKGPNDVPDKPHFAVIIYETTSVYVPGDERSRTAPGHGYPEHTDVYDTFEHWVTEDQEDLEKFILKLEQESKKPYQGPKPYVFFKVEGKGYTEVKSVLNLKF